MDENTTTPWALIAGPIIAVVIMAMMFFSFFADADVISF